MHRCQQTLYFFTVFLTVYRMRERGLRRQPRDLLNDLGTTGQLYFGPVPLDDYGLRMEARLITPKGQDLILPLQYAQIRRIQGVIHIVGKEYYGRRTKSKVVVWRQSWMCTNEPQEAHKLLSRVQASGMAVIFGDDDEDIY
jgi:hypothetical protein